jgi:DNA-binding MarR family transcriptional regulator
MGDTPLSDVEAGMAFYGGLLPGLDIHKLAPMWHIFNVGHMVAVDLDRIASRFGLSIADVHLLGTVRIEREEPIRATDLASTLDVSQAALSIRIRRLERAGLLIKTMIAGDRRAFALALTAQGLQIADAAVAAFARDAKLVRALGRLADDDLGNLTRIMGTLHDAMDRMILAGKPDDT